MPEALRGKTLAEANFRNATGMTVLCIRRAAADPMKPRTVVIPRADSVLQPDDKLIVFGETRKLDELS